MILSKFEEDVVIELADLLSRKEFKEAFVLFNAFMATRSKIREWQFCDAVRALFPGRFKE